MYNSPAFPTPVWICCSVFFAVISAKLHPDGFNYTECAPAQETCEYWLVIQEKLTMIYEKDLVYAHHGGLYLYNEHHSNFTTKVPFNKVMSVDGVNRMVVAVNGTVPGPPIVVYVGQMVTIHIRNMLLSNSVTIHFHGLHQKDTPYFDGMPYITQCPIAAGQTFTHEFKASPKGTFWYHSHVGAQRTNGVFGAFIIKERTPTRYNYTDMILMVGDWHHENSDEVYIKMIYGNYIGRDRYETTHTLEGGNFSAVPWVSGLINGRGRYIDKITGKYVMAPLAWFNVTRGKKYRFRVIGTGAIYPLRISIDKHKLEVISSDGYDIQPWIVESFIINPGERYDFLLDANQDFGNYWIRAESLEVGVKNHTIQAGLHYLGGSSLSDPNSERERCTDKNVCTVLNCPFAIYPIGQHTKCVKMSEMKSILDDDPPPKMANDSMEFFLNFAFPGDGIEKFTPGAVNGRKFEYPGVNSLFQNEQIESDYDCDKKDCGEDKICHCHFQITVPYNKTIQMIWLNVGSGSGWAHPIHLHGHSFYLIKMVYPPQDKSTGLLTGQTKDIDCGKTRLEFCNEAKWKNPTWKNGNIPGVNVINPIRKDTIIVPTGGYAVIRLKSTNPGKWFLHCHIEVHALEGMAMVLNEAPEREIKPPPGFPVCNNFYNDRSRDMTFIKENACKSEAMEKLLITKSTMNIIVTAILAIIIILQILVICACAVLNRRHLLPKVDRHKTRTN